MIIIFLFFLGFILGLAYSLIGEKLPLLVPEVEEKKDNSWILNLFIGIINGLVMVISYEYYGISYEFFASLIVSALLLIIFLTDFKYMIILDSPLIIGGIAISLLKWYYFGIKTAGISLLSGVILFLFMLLIGWLGGKIFKKEALGGGDIKLAAIIGIILEIRLGLIAIILSSLLAMPYALACIMLKKDREVPFGPFLVGSMAIVFIFSEKFMNIFNFF